MKFLILLSIMQINEQNFPKEYILFFGADWCKPCQATKVEIEELRKHGWEILDIKDAKITKTVPIFIVNYDKHQSYCSKYNINVLPTMIKIVNGKEVKRISGFKNKIEIHKLAGCK